MTASAARRPIKSLAAVLLAGACTVPLAAQRSHQHAQVEEIILRGTVVRQDSVTPAPYSTVEVLEAKARRFSNDEGQFSFKLAPGRYHLRVRQIGFEPRDTAVLLSYGLAPALLVVRLVARPITLSKVQVVRPQFCTIPGVDSAEEPILYAMMSAVRENASRELLLRRTYPFEYTVEDVQMSGPAQAGAPSTKPTIETLGYRSDAMMPYRRGATVFTDRSDPRGAWERMRLPSIVDFVDEGFVSSHCFDYGYAESGDLQIHFRPLESITTPDVEGTVNLDTSTYVIRSAVVKLTRSQAVARGYERLEVNTTYREVVPRVAVAAVISSAQEYQAPDPATQHLRATEVQSLRTLRFLHSVPEGVPREQVFPGDPRSVAVAAQRGISTQPAR